MATSAATQPYAISTIAGGAPPPTPVSGVAASIGTPSGVSADGAGNLYFSALHCVFKLSASGTLTLVAGNGRPGYAGDGGPAVSAQLDFPIGLALTASGNLYIADQSNHRIREVSPAGVITTVAGTGVPGYSGDGGPATSAQLNYPGALAADAAGDLYIADTANNRIRELSSSGMIVTVAGNGTAGSSGDAGPATSAELTDPAGVALDSAGNLYLAYTAQYKLGLVRKVSTSGIITTVAGGGAAYPGDGGPATSAQLIGPAGVAVDSAGNLYIADEEDHRIRQVSSDGQIATVAGTGAAGYSGDGGRAAAAQLNYPDAVALDSFGDLYIADRDNYRIRQVSPGGLIATVAGDGFYWYSGDGGSAASAQIYEPAGLAVDGAGNLYFADSGNNRVRKVSPAGVITTVAGDGTPGFAGDEGPASDAQLDFPFGVAMDSSGDLYIADVYNDRIREVSPGGIVGSAAGGGSAAPGDGGPATGAELVYPFGVAVDSAGDLYIAEQGSNRVREVSPRGTITTVAGSGAAGYAGDGGPAVSAQLNQPDAVAVDGLGNVFIADTGNNRIRRVSPSGSIATVAGGGTAGLGDGGPASGAELFQPTGVAVDGSGNLYIADAFHYRVREVSAGGVITTIAGNGASTYAGDGGPAALASLSPTGVAVGAAGRIYVTDASGAVRLLTPVAPLSITTSSALAAAVVGEPYSETLSAAGGLAPYAWSVISGALARGLTLASGGAISGIPAAPGIYRFTAQVADGAGGVASANFTLAVFPRREVRLPPGP